MTTTVVKQELAVTSFSKVYDLDEVETALNENELSEGGSEALRATYEKMLKAGNLRFCVKPNRMPSIDDLVADLPNFQETDIRKQIALCLETEDRLELMPMLLLGDSDIGKTHFAKQLARLLGTSSHYLAMSSLTAG